jgi:hypothetical protein
LCVCRFEPYAVFRVCHFIRLPLCFMPFFACAVS